jgi:hypothetical protein
MSRKRSRNPGTSCTTSYRLTIWSSGLEVLREITHRKPSVEEAGCLINIGCKWIISFVPISFGGALLTSIRGQFDQAFFSTQVLRAMVSESEVHEVISNWKGRPKFGRGNDFHRWLIGVSPDYARRYFPVVVDQDIFIRDVLMNNKD